MKMKMKWFNMADSGYYIAMIWSILFWAIKKKNYILFILFILKLEPDSK
jgi:hypothetical protein